MLQCRLAADRSPRHRRRVVARIAELSAKVKVGDPLDPETQVGAIITPQHLEKIVGYVLGASARVQPSPWRLPLDLGLGQFMSPTILSAVTPDMAVAREEVFGPVLSVLTFETTEAIRIANSIDYGLSAGVWSRDFDTCLTIGRKVRAGTIWMNTFMDGASELPFGGYRQSGLGRELGRHAVEDYTETKTLNMHIGGRTGWWMPQTWNSVRRRPMTDPHRHSCVRGFRKRKWFPLLQLANGRNTMRKFLTTTAVAGS